MDNNYQNFYNPFWGDIRMNPFKLAGNALASFLDFSAGVFIVYLGTLILDYHAGIPSYLLGGILGIAPDFDTFYMFFRKGVVYGDHHQYITHRPIFGIVTASIVGYLFGGNFWAAIVPVCFFWHYLHDTEGFGGGGVAWFWPFSDFYYSPLRTVSPEKSLMAQSGKHDAWLESTWLIPTKTSVIETIIGATLVGIVLVHIFDWKVGLLAIIVVLFGVGVLWLARSYFKISN